MRIDGQLVAPVADSPAQTEAEEQAVLVTFDLGRPIPWPRRGAPPEPVADLETLEDDVDRALRTAGVGELDGVQTRGSSVSLFAYGPDAEQVWSVIRPAVLRCPHRSGTVTLRYGWCGAPTRSLPV